MPEGLTDRIMQPMKTKMAILTILASVSLWAVAQNGENDKGMQPDNPAEGTHHEGGKNDNSEGTNSGSGYYHGSNTNHWRGNTNDWNNSNTNRHHWKESENPPRN
jgi:hypothetical protein